MKELYEIDNVVKVRSGHMKNCIGQIKNVEKLFKETDSNGRFVDIGLTTIESTITSIAIPYQFDGETLIVNYPEKDYGQYHQKAQTMISKFYGYVYTVRFTKEDNPKLFLNELLILLNEGNLDIMKS